MSQLPENDQGISWGDAAELWLKGSKDSPEGSLSNVPEVDSPLTRDELKGMLGDNLLGSDALNKMQEYLKDFGVPVESVWKSRAVPLRKDVEFAKGHNEMLIIPPVDFNLGKMGIPLTLNNISGLFEAIYARDNKPIPILQDVWYKGEAFAAYNNDTLRAFYLHRDPLNNSQLVEYKKELEKSDAVHKKLYDPSVLEVVLAELFYYTVHQKILFPTPVITRSITAMNLPVYFSGFNARGFVLQIGSSPYAYHYPVRSIA